MDLETVIQSEVSQQEENKDRTSARINGVELHGTDDLTKQKQRHRRGEQICGCQEGKLEWG